MLPDYAELHCLSNFSFLRGASHPHELVARAKALGYTALALTDEASFAGSVRAHLAAKEAGLKLIHGTEMRLADGMHLVFLACNREGYGNLAALVTLARRRADKGCYRLTPNDLTPLVPHGAVPDCLVLWVADAAATEAQAHWLAERFGPRAWIAFERHLQPDDAARLAHLRELGAAAGLPLLAAGDVHMHVKSRRPLQDVLTALRENTTVFAAGHALYPNGERSLRARAKLAMLYPPELLAETLRVAQRCRFSLDELRYEYPDEVVPEGHTPASWLRSITEDGLRGRYPDGVPETVRERIEHELNIIGSLRYEPYFLTVYDIVHYARGEGILCQGRGSAANSAVCYALGITEVDPARSALLFERFISTARNEPPDIDVDFEHERREEVMQYIYRRYGRDRTAITAALITYRTRGALRDAGRALGFGRAQIDALAKSLAWWDDRTQLPQRLQSVGLQPDSPRVAKWLALADALRGFPRHLSQHVGGFVMSRGALSRLVPIENAAMAERSVIQWDKDDLDALGLLKVDVLALGMLSALRRGLEYVSQSLGRPFTLADIPPEDPATYRMLQEADAVGVFQVESRAQMAMLPRLKPARFYDLVIEVSLVRPGPIQGDMVHPYLRRRQGLEPVSYPSPAVKKVLERTLGVPIFQEQAMELVMVAAGFSAADADRLRRAMAAWRRNGNIGPFEARLKEGLRERGYSEDFARRLFRQLEGFASYGFPESHAASFALLAYASAWLKRHHPAAFLCALLNSQPMGFYAPAQLVQDARRHGVAVRPVDVRHSGWDNGLEYDDGNEEPNRRVDEPRSGAIHHTAHKDPQRLATARWWNALRFSTLPEAAPAVRLGLRQIGGFSRDAAERIEAARRERPFNSVTDLAARASLDARHLRLLARADALVHLAGHRREAAWAAAGVRVQGDLFDGLAPREVAAQLATPTEGENLVDDYASINLTLGRHPLALLRAHLARRRFVPLQAVNESEDRTLVRAAGLVTGRQRPGTAGGVVFVTIEDETGVGNVVVYTHLVDKQRRELLNAGLLGVYGQVQREGRVVHLVAKRLVDLSAWLGRLAARSRDFH